MNAAERWAEAVMRDMGNIVKMYRNFGLTKAEAHERLTVMVLNNTWTPEARAFGELAFDTLWEIENV